MFKTKKVSFGYIGTKDSYLCGAKFVTFYITPALPASIILAAAG